ncbi:MAG: 50S ribosomal protein L10 [Chloroflexi bacterium]|nr:50S ribosomal protein L10 [Chloroflexota bacterium]
MVTKKKYEDVDELTDMLSKSEFTVLTDYRGLTVSELAKLRKQLREAGVEYHVAKNTLLHLAAERAGYPDIDALLAGPTAIAVAHDDASKAAKILRDYARTSKVFSIKGGVLSKRVLSEDEVGVVADLPRRDVLVGKVLGTMQAPIVNLVGVLSGPTRGLAYVLQARIKQLEGAA